MFNVKLELTDLYRKNTMYPSLPSDIDTKSYQEPRRILYIQPVKGHGGSFHSLYELVRGLDKSKYQPIVLFYWPSPYHDMFEKCGAKVFVLSGRVSPGLLKIPSHIQHNNWHRLICAPKNIYNFVRRDWPLALNVIRLIRSEGIHLVHHNLSLGAARPMVIAAKVAGVSQVCHFRLFSKIPFMAKKLSPFVDAFIYISQAISEYYCNQGLPSNKGHIVYNAIDVESFKNVKEKDLLELKAELGLKDNERVISNIARLDSWKGQDYFLEAMMEVIKIFPHTKALIVGDHKIRLDGERYRDRLHKLVVDLGLSKHVIFTGYRTDIPCIIAASDIVVHSASDPEPFGRVIVEAMAAGRPVIATAAGGVLDIIENNITGLLVPLRSASSMANAIIQLLHDPVKAKDIGQRAQDSAQKRFSVQQHVSAIEKVYQDVLTANK